MKKVWILITLAVVVLVSAGLTSCKKKEGPVSKDTVEKKVDEAKNTEHPASDKPKDHPAH